MRMLVDVELDPCGAGWIVRITLPDGSMLPARTMARSPQEPFVGPGLDPSVVERINTRAVEGNDLVNYGRYLFDSLIGHAAWSRMHAGCPGGDSLEVALRWKAAHSELHAPLWEAMYDGEQFLSIYDHCSVAITRVIADAPATAHVIMSAPRVLYAIGSDLTDVSIRPGAEFMGVLRAVGKNGSPITPCVLQQASPDTISRAVRRFRPDAVHIICHGQNVRDQPRLLLRQDDPARSANDLEVTPEILYDSLTGAGAGTPAGAGVGDAGGRAPEIVVLSACETGASGAVKRAGGGTVTPFAAALVSMGIPIVVAMSGRVADAACRLFSRRFAESLTNGHELVAAVAHGRRAAYRGREPDPESPQISLDCLLPAVFVAAGVEPGFAPVHTNAGVELRRRLDEYGLTQTPVFCGRQEFFTAYDRLVDPAEPLSSLVVYWSAQGVGKDRLLRELVARALGDGHIPVVVRPKPLPRRALDAGAQIGIAIEYAREAFGVDAAPSNLLEYTAAVADVPARPPTGRPGIRGALAAFTSPEDPERPEITAVAIAEAIKLDLKRLVDDARAAGTVAREAGALVLLSEIESWDKGLQMLTEHLLRDSGIRIDGAKVPVVATWKDGGAGGEALVHLRGDRDQLNSWEFLELAPLKGEEEMLAYQWVLMHPREGSRLPNARNVYVVIKPDGRWRTEFHDQIEGLPRKFLSDNFLYLARIWQLEHEFAVDDDEAILARYANGHAP